ncbi:MAG: prepilin-type N-terminal cleavage/methylation domain-containing protein [Candidatus Omnitrophota bacterium]|nr:prepilin-type N-terminal cleavage/methylation domain-containing protein [Candidatus Omnitrophota bacterium]
MLILNKFLKRKRGFTLLELMIAVGVLVVALVGLLGVFAHLIVLNENSSKLTLAVAACQAKLEEMRNSTFSTLYTTYNGAIFNPTGFSSGEARGAVYINNSNLNLLQVFVSVSWRTRSNRVIGEDINLNGIRDAGEDLNGNLRLDSPGQLATLMAQR